MFTITIELKNKNHIVQKGFFLSFLRFCTNNLKDFINKIKVLHLSQVYLMENYVIKLIPILTNF